VALIQALQDLTGTADNRLIRGHQEVYRKLGMLLDLQIFNFTICGVTRDFCRTNLSATFSAETEVPEGLNRAIGLFLTALVKARLGLSKLTNNLGEWYCLGGWQLLAIGPYLFLGI
jgi:hypothetical protein